MSTKPEFLGKYRLQRELGRGGMAVVYEGVDTELGRRVAVKVLHPRPEATPEQARIDEERFLREARLCAALPKHPHIVGVHDAATHDGRRYIVMELVDGRSYSDWRAQDKPPRPRQIEVLRDVALAVHHAHEHGIVHRDLKPANILVDADGRPHITDFGLAKLDTGGSVSLTAEGFAVGTPGYMSPEQAQGLKSADRRADVYSLGILLYEIIAGRTPFQGESAIAILTQVIRDPVKPPSTILKGRPLTSIDIVLERICLKAVARNVDERYPSAQALAADLTTWLKGGKVVVVLPREARPRRVWPWLVSAAALLAVSAAVALRPPPPPPAPMPPRAVLRVPAVECWTDSGVDVRAGETLQAACEGTWSNHEGSQPRVPATGAARLLGTPHAGFTTHWPVNGGNLMALVGRIGAAGPAWVLPPDRPVRMPASGRLYLGPNDAPPGNDNGGELTVTIRGVPSTSTDARAALAVPAGFAWTDTGIDLEPGDAVDLIPSGTWSRDSTDRKTPATGESKPPADPTGFPVPGGPVMALVGRVGTATAPWTVSLKDRYRAAAAGRLFLGPNDGAVENNHGELRVTILIDRRP